MAKKDDEDEEVSDFEIIQNQTVFRFRFSASTRNTVNDPAYTSLRQLLTFAPHQ